MEGDHYPADVADQLGISLGAVYSSLAYYHEYPEEMKDPSQPRGSRTIPPHDALSPPEPAE